MRSYIMSWKYYTNIQERLSSRLGERASVMLTAYVEVGQILKEELSISMDDTVPSFFWGCARYRAHERYNHDRAVSFRSASIDGELHNVQHLSKISDSDLRQLGGPSESLSRW